MRFWSDDDFSPEIETRIWNQIFSTSHTFSYRSFTLKSEAWNYLTVLHFSSPPSCWSLKSEVTSWNTIPLPEVKPEIWNLNSLHELCLLRGWLNLEIWSEDIFLKSKLRFRGPSEVWSQRFNLKIGRSHLHTKNWNLKPETWNKIRKLFTPPHENLKRETWNLKWDLKRLKVVLTGVD